MFVFCIALGTMADELADSFSSVRLFAEENTLIGASYDPTADNVNASQVSLILIAKYISSSSPNFSRLRNALIRLWAVKEGFTIREVGYRLYAIQFFNEKDHNKVMAGRSWIFYETLLCLEFASPTLSPREIQFTSSPFWIRFLNVPLGYQTRQFAEILGAACGYFINLDTSTPVGWTYFMRIKVVIDIRKPLRRGVKIAVGDNKTKWIVMQYERMPNFCFLCGIIGHLYEECDKFDQNSKQLAEGRVRFSGWVSTSYSG